MGNDSVFKKQVEWDCMYFEIKRMSFSIKYNPGVNFAYIASLDGDKETTQM